LITEIVASLPAANPAILSSKRLIRSPRWDSALARTILLLSPHLPHGIYHDLARPCRF